MRTTNFDAIAASAPLDRQASVVRDGSGDLWNTPIPESHKRWVGPPPMRRVTTLMPNAQEVAAELVGRRFGRLKVVGLLYEEGKKQSAAWVVRCDCGYYEARKAKALRNGDVDHMCLVCHRVEKLRQRGSRPSTRATRKAAALVLDRLAAGANR